LKNVLSFSGTKTDQRCFVSGGLDKNGKLSTPIDGKTISDQKIRLTGLTGKLEIQWNAMNAYSTTDKPSFTSKITFAPHLPVFLCTSDTFFINLFVWTQSGQVYEACVVVFSYVIKQLCFANTEVISTLWPEKSNPLGHIHRTIEMSNLNKSEQNCVQ